MRYELCEKIVKHAVSLSHLRRGITTANQCGDYEWARKAIVDEERGQKLLEDLKSSATKQELRFCNDVTNAPI